MMNHHEGDKHHIVTEWDKQLKITSDKHNSDIDLIDILDSWTTA